MADARVKAVAILCLVALCIAGAYAQPVPRGLSQNYYRFTCPNAESIIRAEVNKAFAADRTIPAGLIRMFFHDCFVRGCDASILLDNPDSEKLGAPNANSLRGFEVLDAAKAALESACPGRVSCADVIAYAARDAMELAGNIRVTNWVGAHLLVKHNESRRPSSWKQADITRTKEEAKSIIHTFENRIRSGKISLADLAVSESDCSSARKRGDLGYFGRGDMQNAFEDAAFALKPGEMSHLVETASGIHLIERLE